LALSITDVPIVGLNVAGQIILQAISTALPAEASVARC